MINVKRIYGIKYKILRITGGKGIGVVIDCIKTENTISDSIRVLGRDEQLLLLVY